jgi:hypothetical protein
VREVVIPRKMCSPALLAWMKQSHECFSDRIRNHCSPEFMLVAAVAAERQIVSRHRPAETAWYDVINCEGICRVSRLRAAVFATMLAAISNQAAQLSRNVPFRHVRENGSRVDPSTPLGQHHGIWQDRPVPPYGQHVVLQPDRSAASILRIQHQ